MAIEVGKDVVAIENHSKGLFKKGQIFMCLGIKNPICSHSIGLINIGFPIGTERNYCLVVILLFKIRMVMCGLVLIFSAPLMTLPRQSKK